MKTIKYLILRFTLIVIILTISSILLYLYLSLDDAQIKNQKKELERYLNYISELDTNLYNHLSEKLNLRITMIDNDGRVFYDSDFDYKLMDNHKNREELENLSEGDLINFSSRFSNTKGRNYLYAAKRLPTYYLRVSRPLNSFILFDLPFLKTKFIIIFIPLTILLFFLAYLLTRKIYKPLKEIVEVSGEFEKGELDKRIFIEGPSEIQRLSKNLNSMAKNIRALNKVYQSRAQIYQVMLKSLKLAVLLINRSNTIVEANAFSYKLFDTNSSMDGDKLSIYLNNIELNNEIKIAFVQKQDRRLKIKIREESLYPIDLSVIISYVDEDFLLISLEDITRLLKLETIRKDFVSNVSHELKTPLTSIIGFSEILLEEYNKDYIEKIYNQGISMLQIIEDLLLLSKLEKDSSMIQADYEITLLMQRVMDRVEDLEKLADFSYTYDISTLYCNESFILVALSNLILNAIRYNNNFPKIRIHFYKENDFNCISIKDNGVGISIADQSRIFERFYRIDNSRDKKIGGTGLGLAIVKHVINLHLGSIEIQSELNKGSTFILKLAKKRKFDDARKTLYEKQKDERES